MATVSDADEHPGLPQTAAAQLTTAARVVAQRAPVTLTVARHRALPTAATSAPVAQGEETLSVSVSVTRCADTAPTVAATSSAAISPSAGRSPRIAD